MPFTQQVPPIEGGCHYALQVAVSCHGAGPFPTGAALLARVRNYETAAVVALLSTADASLYLIDDQTLEIQLPASITARLSSSSALVEFMIGSDDPEAVGIALRLPVSSVASATLGSSTAVVMSLYDITLSQCAIRRAPTIATTAGTSLVAGTAVTGLVPLVQQLDQFNAAAAAHLSHMGI